MTSSGIGRHIRVLDLGGQSRRRVQVERERDILSQRLRCIRLLVLLIVLAHGLGRVIGPLRVLAGAATSARTRDRSGSETLNSWSYPQVLIAVSTVNRVSLVSRATGLWFCARDSSASRANMAA